AGRRSQVQLGLPRPGALGGSGAQAPVHRGAPPQAAALQGPDRGLARGGPEPQRDHRAPQRPRGRRPLLDRLQGPAAMGPPRQGAGSMTDAVFTIRQSWLTEWLICPERARALWFGEVVDGPTDATAIGTGLH